MIWNGLRDYDLMRYLEWFKYLKLGRNRIEAYFILNIICKIMKF